MGVLYKLCLELVSSYCYCKTVSWSARKSLHLPRWCRGRFLNWVCKSQQDNWIEKKPSPPYQIGDGNGDGRYRLHRSQNSPDGGAWPKRSVSRDWEKRSWLEEGPIWSTPKFGKLTSRFEKAPGPSYTPSNTISEERRSLSFSVAFDLHLHSPVLPPAKATRPMTYRKEPVTLFLSTWWCTQWCIHTLSWKHATLWS